MNYQESLEFIHSINTGPRPGLTRIARLLELMGNPQDSLKIIHVAGTNGKGSTCTMLSYILAEAGYTVGLNISPYVLNFRERIQCNNEMIPEQELAELTTTLKGYWKIMLEEGDAPSEFELIVAMAFAYFHKNKCDFVVMEVGMGGRLDASNVIKTPVVSVISSVSIDHSGKLGTDVTTIAHEKAGIIKQDGRTVCYAKQDIDALAVIMERCSQLNNQLFMAHNIEIHSSTLSGNEATIENLRVRIPLAGEHQVYNAATVIMTCRVLQQLGFSLSDQAIVRGIAQTTFPSRVEILGEAPLIIVDGAHNPSGAKALVELIDRFALGKKSALHAVVGIMKDKDVDGFIHLIASRCTSLIATSLPDYPRFISPQKLAEKARPHCDAVTIENDPYAAYRQALARCAPEDTLLLCGSLYLASALRKHVLGEDHESYQ